MERAERGVKIVATVGPAISSPAVMRDMIAAGVDVFRVNLAHGTHRQHEEHIALARDAAASADREVAVLADLAGPKIRLGEFRDGGADLDVGSKFVITTTECVGDETQASSTYDGLVNDVKSGDVILVDDGRIRLQVQEVAAETVTTVVRGGGRISDHKGMNLPGVQVSAPALGTQDITDLRRSLDAGVDLVALSFVRTSEDADRVREVMQDHGRFVPVFAKLEKPEAVASLEAIVAAFDGLMVARGDLGVEMALEDVPLVQKRAIECARSKARSVIVATQMLESMIENPEPTRAEVSDVANAVLDGADAVMLSGETSVGRNPVAAVAMMDRVIRAIERGGPQRARSTPIPGKPDEAVAHAAVDVAYAVNASAIVAFTSTGRTARLVASHRPGVPLLACATRLDVARQLMVTWGVRAIHVWEPRTSDDMVELVNAELVASRAVAVGSTVVLVGGMPPGIVGGTNTLRVHRVGDRAH